MPFSPTTARFIVWNSDGIGLYLVEQIHPFHCNFYPTLTVIKASSQDLERNEKIDEGSNWPYKSDWFGQDVGHSGGATGCGVFNLSSSSSVGDKEKSHWWSFTLSNSYSLVQESTSSFLQLSRHHGYSYYYSLKSSYCLTYHKHPTPNDQQCQVYKKDSHENSTSWEPSNLLLQIAAIFFHQNKYHPSLEH